MKSLHRTGRVLGFVVVGLLFALALRVLHHELSLYHWDDIIQTITEVRPLSLLMAGFMTVLSYALLTTYDVLALRILRKKLPYRQTALASFLAYVFSYNIGLSIFGGGTVRFRLYSLWGLEPLDIGKVIGFSALTFWLGLFTLTGFVCVVHPLPLPEILHWSMRSTQPLGILLLLGVSFYLGLTASGKRTISFGERPFTLPTIKHSLQQIALGMLDILAASSILYILLPEQGAPDFMHFIGIYALAMFVALVSHVPGGVGVFESVMLVFLSPGITGTAALSSLVLYRVLYYFLPFALGLLLYAGFELLEKRRDLQRLASFSARITAALTPRIFAVVTFAGGVLLLVSGATPADPDRVDWLRSVIPLPLLEISHFLGSLVGLLLLVLSRGIVRKLDAAYHLTLLALAAGILFSLLKGLDWEEASILTFFLLVFLPSKPSFHRKAALFADRFSLEWFLIVFMVLASSIWLGFFSYKHVEYSHDLWWTFAFNTDASRFLRASTGSAALLLVVGLVRLLKPARALQPLPQDEELQQAKSLARLSSRSLALLVMVRDKAILFSEQRSAFIMYGMYGNCWVALGGPIGDQKETTDLLWDFRERCDEHGGWEVFYQVHPESLPLLVEAGYTFIKLGEEAIIDLSRFSLEGNSRKSLRHSHGRLLKQGYTFEVVLPRDTSALLPELKQISDSWLLQKHSSEKGFSLGYFDEHYLQQCDIAIVRKDQQIFGFANILASGPKQELSIDLMRYLPDAAPGIMDFLFCQLMLWGREQGYQYFNLGMAPLAGMETKATAPLWNRFADFLFQYGEHFYNFQGVRSYKEKYHPRWEPRYLAYNPSASLPLVLTQVTALVAGGMKGILKR